MKLKFLGTGGGRYVTGEQRRKTAGILIRTEETQIHVDPGPGALVYAQNEKPGETDSVLVSHGHLDHSNDAEAIIEMMTECHDHPGRVVANETALHGFGEIEKRVSEYHQNLCLDVEEVGEGDSLEIEDLKFEFQEMFHSDPRTVGFKARDDDRCIGFWTDTEFSEELLDFYSDCDVMVIYCTMPRDADIDSHTSLSEVPDIVEKIEPSTVIVTHFGYRFLDSDMETQEDWLKENIDQKVIFASDGMEFPGNRSLSDF